MADEVLVEQRGAARWITIDRPERRNALTLEVIANIHDAIATAAHDRSIRAIVLTGTGDAAFCAGADLKTGALGFDYTEPYSRYAQLLRAAHHGTIPLIACVNGACMAGGIGLLGMCDLALAAPHATFGLPEVKVGLFPMQVLAVATRAVPRRTLAWMCLTGQSIDAEAAVEAGLINAIESDVVAATQRLVDLLASNSPAALRRGLYALKRVETMSFEEAMAFTESQLGLLALTDDAREGPAAFAEKRRPNWKLA